MNETKTNWLPVDWKPIETAPKDGTAILIYDEAEPCIMLAEWNSQKNIWGSVLENAYDNDHLPPVSFNPSHWTELPQKPNKTK